MNRDEDQDIDVTELLNRTAAVAETLCAWAPCLHTQELRDGFAELGQRLAQLVVIGRHPGGLSVVNGAILDTFEDMQRLADKMVGQMKN